MYEQFAHYYDQLGWRKFSEARASFVLKFVADRGLGVKRVLDIACGTGTFAMLLAEKGISVVGLDISKDMIAVARKKSESSEGVEFHIGDMRDFKLGSRFDLVTCNYDSLNHLLTEEDVLSTFRCVYAHLRPEGTFLFDMNTISGVQNFKYQDIKHGEDHLVLRYGTFDEDSGIATLLIDGFAKKDEQSPYYVRFRETIREKGYPIERLYGLLRQAGFKGIEPVGPSAGKEPAELEKERRVLIHAAR